MWPKNYADYPPDKPLIHYPVSSNQGINGCEMHELNGWGESYHRYKRKSNFIMKILAYFFGTEKQTLSK